MSAQASQDLSSARALGGRRRAQLVAGGGRATGTPLSWGDVEALRADASPQARAALAAKFGRQYDTLIAGRARALAVAVLDLLSKDHETAVRQALAEAVATARCLPRGAAIRLATDCIEVAHPILERSPVLDDDDLAAILGAQTAHHALAIAGRERLSESLGGGLADTGEPAVIAALVDNAGAELSSAALLRLYRDYGDDQTIQRRLLRRFDLPLVLIEQALGAIGERVGWSVIERRRMSKAEARELMARLRDAAARVEDEEAPPDPATEGEQRHKLATAALGPDHVVASLREGDLNRVELSLALLANVNPARARRLLYGTDHRGLAALCARAGFAVPHYVALRMAFDLAERALENADPETVYTSETIALVVRQYDLIRREGTYNTLCLAT
jgi:uncharacterized protein (DUF2336 family)